MAQIKFFVHLHETTNLNVVKTPNGIYLETIRETIVEFIGIDKQKVIWFSKFKKYLRKVAVSRSENMVTDNGY